MEIWVDAQLSPSIATYIFQNFNIQSKALREIGLRDASDNEIFIAAKKQADIIILTKDADFIDLILKLGSPPKIILLSCGNTSNNVLQIILKNKLLQAISILQDASNEIVEISD